MSSNNKDFQLSDVFNVKGKVALVTGGGSGIGLMATQALAVNGAKVYIVGRTEAKLQTVKEVHGKDIAGEIIPLPADITSKSAVDKLVKEIESREGYLDILINNAGIAPGKVTPDGKNAEELKKNLYDDDSFESWNEVYTTNVVAPFFMSVAFLPLLQKATERVHGWSGTIVNISSISGLVRISQGHVSYNVSKGAVIHLNKILSSEIQSSGLKIRVNSIAPGVFPSEMTTQESRDDNQKSEMPKDHKGGLPSQRPGNDRDMAAAVLFTVATQYLNGQCIPVDGKSYNAKIAFKQLTLFRRISHPDGHISMCRFEAATKYDPRSMIVMRDFEGRIARTAIHKYEESIALTNPRVTLPFGIKK